MAEEYLKQLSMLVKKVAPGKIKDDLECKHFFSGAAVYAQGRICMSLTPVGLAIKLPEESRNTLIKEQGAKPLRYFPKGPIKQDYVVLPKALLTDVRALRAWMKVSVEYVISLPLPAKGRRK